MNTDEIKTAFKNSQTVICKASNHNCMSVVVNKDSFTLKDNYFIKGSKAISIENCEIIKETT